MNENDAITLEAFFTALVELDSSLAASIQAEIQEIGKCFAQDSEQAINKLRKLVRKNEVLNELYKTARVPLQQAYDERERTKHFEPGKKDSSTAKPLFKLENTLAPIPPNILEEIAPKILTATDSQQLAAQELQKVRNQPNWLKRLLS